MNALKNREVTVAVHEKPNFRAVTRGKSQLALLGIAAVYAHGSSIINENGIDDPASGIGVGLAYLLRERYGMNVSAAPVLVKTDDVAQLRRDHPDLDVLLEVKTTNWAFAYYLASLSKYRVLYSARLRLIDLKRGKVLAEGACERDPEQTSSSPTYNQLLDNNAAGLKRELKYAEESCIGEFGSKVLRMRGVQSATASGKT